MKQKKYLIYIGIIFLILVGYWGLKNIDKFLKIDSCLDQGGSWNYKLNKCETE
jgi:hypothetical protein